MVAKYQSFTKPASVFSPPETPYELLLLKHLQKCGLNVLHNGDDSTHYMRSISVWSRHYEKKKIYLGLFKNAEDAAKAYDKKATELFGEFACLNFDVEGPSPTFEANIFQFVSKC
jgi:hypothetical protein